MSTPTQWRWHPVLENEVAEFALSVAERIGEWVAQTEPTATACLARGAAGYALSTAYLKSGVPRGVLGTAVRHWIWRSEQLLLEAARQPERFDPSLFGGVAGYIWVVQQLRGLASDDPESLRDELDSVVQSVYSGTHWRGFTDLVSGVVGIGVAALSFGSSLAGSTLTFVIDRLAAAAVAAPAGLVWLRSPRQLPHSLRAAYPEGLYDTGTAHGMAGVVLFLSYAVGAGVRDLRLLELLKGAVTWLAGTEAAESDGPRFPLRVHPSRDTREYRQYWGWCYGDLTVSFALLRAYSLLNDKVGMAHVLAIAHAAAEIAPKQATVAELGLCHGVFGVAHLFSRYYNFTGDTRFRDAAARWLKHGLEVSGACANPAEFVSLKAHEVGGGLLEGLAGIGLTLRAAATALPPHWDACLLLSPNDGSSAPPQE